MADRNDLPAPAEGLVVTHFLTVRDAAVSRDFYASIFGGQVVLAENPTIARIANGWIIMNPGGGPTPDKPDIRLTPPEPGDPVSAFLNVRVADIAAFYAAATAKGAQFVTEPLPQGRTALLPARSRRLPHRDRPGHRDARGHLRRPHAGGRLTWIWV
jgi:predicted enzyme related to lactoylglutathione lyase